MAKVPSKQLGDNQKTVVSSSLNQVIDLIQEDVSGSATRRKYQTFVTGGIGPGVTSSLYQTVYDQDFTLQTANPVMDMTVGLFHYDDGTNLRPNLVTKGTGYARSTTTKQLTFDSRRTMMMREKINIYRQYAGYLLGDPDDAFCLDKTSYPSLKDKVSETAGSEFSTIVKTDTTVMDACVFLNVKRLFKRDGVRKETFALRTYKQAPAWDTAVTPANWTHHYTTAGALASESSTTARKNNVLGTTVKSSEYGVQIIADIGGRSDNSDTPRGDVARLKLASDTSKTVGLIFYQAGIAVLNLGGSTLMEGQNFVASAASGANPLDIGLGQNTLVHGIYPAFEPRDIMYGIIAGMDDGAGTDAGSIGAKTTGQLYLGVGTQNNSNATAAVSNRQTAGTGPATFYPDLLVSASIDDIVDHIGYTRFSSGSLTGMAFQNQTKINSSIYFCRAEANEFNTSNNPTWDDENGKGVMLQDDDDKAFTYITTVLLHDDQDNIVAVAKLNRPIEKNEESEVTIRVRLDF